MTRSSDSLTAPMDDPFGDSANRGDVSTQPDIEWIHRAKTAIAASNNDQSAKMTTAWARNYRAYNNRHFSGSKYDGFKYRNRSKLFKPKTRSAVRKNNATAASALFSTDDVVSITPERAGDRLQQATAAFVHAALNFRLDRANRWAGPNWFMTAMGAREDSQLTGICVSKQHWEYETRTSYEIVKQTVEVPVMDPMGLPVTDPMTGLPVTETAEEEIEQEIVEVVRDRLMITPLPSEHAFIDTAGDWRDPIQEGGFFVAAYPTRREDVKRIVLDQAERNPKGGGRWREVNVEKLTRGSGPSRQQADAVRRSREDGIDRYESRMQGKDDDTIWLYECFYRIDGEDWHWWMLGESILLSDPQPTRKSYPEQSGDRPYVRGVGSLEAHKTHPMSPVEAIQPLQMEINDITNLRLDAMKMGISPITVTTRGGQVDFKQLQNRGPDAHIQVNKRDDIDFIRAPEPTQNSILDVNIISNDLDDLAGVFSGSSVQSNRQLNETVGGMKLLSENANALTEYDLRVWAESWCEPVLRQCVNLIIYYENDASVIAVAGEKAGLIDNEAIPQEMDPEKVAQESAAPLQPPKPPITIDQVLGNLDKAQLQVRVNIGLGALNTEQRMNKLMAGMKATGEMLPMLEKQGYQPNAVALAQEIWGMVGYKDADRFFMRAPKSEDGPPPEVQLEQMRQQTQMEAKKLDIQAKGAAAQLAAKSQMEIEQMNASLQAREIALKEREFEHQKRMDEMQLIIQRQQAQMDQHQNTLNAILKAVQSNQPKQSAQQ